jgi:hypothetical protein
MKRTARTVFAALAVVAMLVPCCLAQEPPPFQPKGNIIKYNQPIRHVIDSSWPADMSHWGEDIPSDVDWNKIMQSPTIEPNWVIADDFRDEFRTPVRTVKWWGSYVGPVFQQTPGGVITLPPSPGIEDGYAISFFRDVPVGPNDSFSHPGHLLGSYILPLDRVSIRPTPYIGWDMHPIFEYEANLMDAHLDHAVSPLADQMGFNQRPGEVYWISIVAEVGHRVRLVRDVDDDGIEDDDDEDIDGDGKPNGEDEDIDNDGVPNGEDDEIGEPRWVGEDTGKFANNHYWGWHTSPVHFNDVATMGHLFMPGNEWEYFGWMPIQPQHGLFDMAFQLKTIPEPASFVLMAVGLGAMYGCRRVRRA